MTTEEEGSDLGGRVGGLRKTEGGRRWGVAFESKCVNSELEMDFNCG